VRPFGFAHAFVWTFAATVLLISGIQALVGLRPSAQTDIVTLGAWQAVAYLLSTFGMLWVHASRTAPLRLLALRPTHPALPVIALALGLAIQLPAESLRQLVEAFRPTSEQDLAIRAALLSSDSQLHTALLMLIAACLVPFVEELFFRGAVFGLLRRGHSPLAAAIVSSVCFVAAHLDFREWLPLSVVAVALGQLRATSGSLLPCLALHVGFNAVTVAAHVSGVSTPWQPMRLGVPLILAGWAATAGLVVAVQRVAAQSREAAAARDEDEP
jgi:membrane protease YdiL (CAAX protease family)